MSRATNTPSRVLPDVSVSDDGRVRHLHLGTPWIQGSMRIDEPFALELEYVQRMMAWLLFAEPARGAKGHARQLGTRTTAIELNAQVVVVCRQWFKLPPDGPRLQVVLADAAQEIRRPLWQGSVDALAVDLY